MLPHTISAACEMKRYMNHIALKNPFLMKDFTLQSHGHPDKRFNLELKQLINNSVEFVYWN